MERLFSEPYVKKTLAVPIARKKGFYTVVFSKWLNKVEFEGHLLDMLDIGSHRRDTPRQAETTRGL